MTTPHTDQSPPPPVHRQTPAENYARSLLNQTETRIQQLDRIMLFNKVLLDTSLNQTETRIQQLDRIMLSNKVLMEELILSRSNLQTLVDKFKVKT